ncbi:MAG: TonB family protein [Pseudomonadales bacterium]|nr:energy transducer TonB [Pseudomonadales bacterium]NIX07593.1 TonB family protein [Pseudomonadales bacterium]
MSTAVITPRDRLGFTLFLAVSLHAAIILGVSFSADLDLLDSPTVEVTFAQHSDLEAPEDADFIAQANQLGSGTESEVLETTTDQEAEFFTNEFADAISNPLPTIEETTLDTRELVTTTAEVDDQAPYEEETPVEENVNPQPATDIRFDDLAQEIASLEARIAADQQAKAKQPRVKRLTSVSAKSADEAAYLNMWRQKVERIGNANYPDSRVYGDLRMLVVLSYDGTLKEVRILESSGHKSLDDAALRIVRLAAPYQQFPVEMRKKYDQLEIIRTWKFSRSGARLGS